MLLEEAQKNKLRKYRIDSADFLVWQEALRIRGYSDVEINKICLRPSPKNSVNLLIALHKNLILNFSRGALTNISRCHGGSKTLECILNNSQALSSLGYTTADIVSVASNDGGGKTLECILNNHQTLSRLGYTTADIISIASNNGGGKTLECILNNRQAISRLGYILADIVSIASNDGGSKNVRHILKFHVNNFVTDNNFSRNEVVKIYARDSGHMNMALLIKHFNLLATTGLDREKIITLACDPNVKQKMHDIVESSKNDVLIESTTTYQGQQ